MTTQTQPAIPDSVLVERDVQFGTGGGRPLRMNLLRPRETKSTALPAVVWVYGGGWRAGANWPAAEHLVQLAQRDYLVGLIEYRLSQESLFPAQIEDCKCAVRYLRAHATQLGIDPDRIGSWGPSAGGHLSAMLGTSGGVADLEGTGGWAEHSSRVQASVDWYGPTDLLGMGTTPWGDHNGAESPESLLVGGLVQEHRELATRANPITYVSADNPPFLIMHGADDRLVPVSQSAKLHENLRWAGVESEVVIVPGKGHENLGPEAVAKVFAFFDKHLNA